MLPVSYGSEPAFWPEVELSGALRSSSVARWRRQRGKIREKTRCTTARVDVIVMAAETVELSRHRAQADRTRWFDQRVSAVADCLQLEL